MIITLYAVDNEITALNTIGNYMKRITDIVYNGGELNPLKAKELLSKENIPNIVLLDIKMGGVDGRELAKLIHGRAFIIFTTGHAEFALESYEYGAVDYLLKPFSFERFLEAIEKVRQRLLLPAPYAIGNEKNVIIKDSRTSKQNIVPLDKIQYVHSNGNYSNVYVEGSPYMLSLLSLKKMYELLGPEQFIRVQKEWVINFNEIENFDFEFIKLKSGEKIKIGRTYKRKFKEEMNNRIKKD